MNINSKIIQNNYSSLNPGYQKNNSSMPKLQAGRNLNSTDQFVSSNKKNKQQVSFSGGDWLPYAIGLVPVLKEGVAYFSMDYLAIVLGCTRVDRKHHKYLKALERNSVISSYCDHGAVHFKEETENLFKHLHGASKAIGDEMERLKPGSSKAKNGTFEKIISRISKKLHIEKEDGKSVHLQSLGNAKEGFDGLIKASTKGILCDDISEVSKNAKLATSGPELIVETCDKVNSFLKLIAESLIKSTETDTYKEAIYDIKPLKDAFTRIRKDVAKTYNMEKESCSTSLTLVKPPDKAPEIVPQAV